jgi:hypothetical protein
MRGLIAIRLALNGWPVAQFAVRRQSAPGLPELFFAPYSLFVRAGHSRLEDGVASARLCPGHPRLTCCRCHKTWMPGTSPGTTNLKHYFIDPYLSKTLKRSNLLPSSSRICSHSFAISPRRRASFVLNGVPAEIRGPSATPGGEQGMPGADAPAAARGVVGSTRVSHRRWHRNHPAFPAQWF